jgi:cyclopropane fatty-acyl-phospholipid synthase-like methyltransferase
MDSRTASDCVDNSIKLFTDSNPDYSVQEPDARRYKTCLQIMTGESILDIGINHGILVNAAAISRQFNTIVGVDIVLSPNAIIGEGITFRKASIIDPEFVSQRFDTVVCMEVIEHIEEHHNETILQNLRDSTNRRLIITVPFDEPEPLWWHDKPGGHRQKFSLEKIQDLFPNALATIEPRWGVEWIFIIEDKSLNNEKFEIISKEKFFDLLK